MFLCSIQFTLRIFFTAFHSLVLASFYGSKNPDWILWAMFVCNQTTHRLCVRHSKLEIEKRDCRQANTCKGIHILYIFTKRIFPFPFLRNVYHCTGWQKQLGTVFLLCSFHCSLRQSSCAEAPFFMYHGVASHVSLFSQGLARTESSY